MTEYNKVNVKLSDSPLNKLKPGFKNETEVTLRMSIKMFYGHKLPYKLLSTTIHETKLWNAFENNISADIRLSETQISKMTLSSGF